MRAIIPILLFFANILLFFQATSYGNDYFRGQLVLGHEVRSFTPCQRKVEYWVLDQTDGDLWKVYQALTHQPYQPIYVELRGRLGPSPRDGFGADYDGQVTARELRRAGLETRGCAENLSDIIFRASGNEPFWNVQISESGILFSEMGKPQLNFPFVHPKVSDRKWVFLSKIQSPTQHDIQVSIDEKRCIDSMSGEHFSFTAQVTLDGVQFMGCTREGLRTLTMDVLKNAEYLSEFSENGKVRLVNGLYKEKLVPDSATELVITLSEKVAYGDLNGDGEEDAAVIMITNSGGSGTFRHLAAVLDEKGSHNHVASKLLGDRVKVKSLSVRSGEIAIEMITHGPNDPICCPALVATQNYLLQDDKLVAAQSLELMNRKWVFRSFGTIGSQESPLPDAEISIEFAADGRLHGSGGCNRYFSSYETGPGGSLTIKQIGSTRMACPQEIMDQEMKYFRSLQCVSTFNVKIKTLQLFYGNGDRVLNYTLSP
jgi:uncharacterized membrane protein/heat shock protein HslJ